MPKEGFTTITIRIETFVLLKDFADKTHRSVPQSIEYLVEEEQKRKNDPKGASP